MGWGSKVALLAFAFLGIRTIVYFLFRKKNDSEDENYMNFLPSLQKRVMEIKVPKQCVPFVIGHGGNKIREIQATTNTEIHFKKGNGSREHGVCEIRGTREEIQLAAMLISDIIVNKSLIGPSQIFVPRRACERIIGKNGETILSLSKLSKADISVESWHQEKDPYHAKITIKGTAEQIERAKFLIEEQVEEDKRLWGMPQIGSGNWSPWQKTKYMSTVVEENERKEEVAHKENLVATGSDGMLEVYVSAIEDPEKFWVQMVGPSTTALDILNEKMTDYYCKKENRVLHKLKEVSVDQIVAAPFWNDNRWYRAEVTDIRVNEYEPDESELILYYVDYGDSAVYKKNKVYELRADFLVLRFQAIECILAKVKPRESWTEEAIDLFESLTYNGLWKPMTARVDGYRQRSTRGMKEGSPVPCVELYDSKDDGTTINVAEEMVRDGFAEWIEKKKSPSKGKKEAGGGEGKEEGREEEKKC